MEEQLNPQDALSIDPEIRVQLKQTAGWAQFLAIVFMVLISFGLLAMIGFSMLKAFFQRFPTRSYRQFDYLNQGAVLTGIGCLLVIGMVSAYFLYRFSSHTRRALYSEDQQALESGVRSLKYYLIIGAVIGVMGMILNIVKNLI
ncbi:MAG: hypothetical protein JO301_06295 [Chitinophagaceae bacterium]|nr:hypothetical protein [Chitinophagaceae bacterium]